MTNTNIEQFIIRFEIIGAIDGKRKYYVETSTVNSDLPVRLITTVQDQIGMAIKLKHDKDKKVELIQKSRKGS